MLPGGTEPGDIIKTIVTVFGEGIFTDSRRLMSAIADYFSKDERSLSRLRLAVNENIPAKLYELRSVGGKERERRIEQITSQLSELYSISQQAANEMVGWFAEALNYKDVRIKPTEPIAARPQTVQTTPEPQWRRAVQTRTSKMSRGTLTKKKAMALKGENIIIPKGYTAISHNSFYGRSGIMSITVPESVKSIAGKAFGACSDLRKIIVDKNNKNYRDVDGILFDKDAKILIKYPENYWRGLYQIPHITEEIGECSFRTSRNLTHVIVSESVVSIGNSAFALCTNLTSIIIPANVKHIGRWVFEYCNNLTVSCAENSHAFRYCVENGIRTEII